MALVERLERHVLFWVVLEFLRDKLDCLCCKVVKLCALPLFERTQAPPSDLRYCMVSFGVVVRAIVTLFSVLVKSKVCEIDFERFVMLPPLS